MKFNTKTVAERLIAHHEPDGVATTRPDCILAHVVLQIHEYCRVTPLDKLDPYDILRMIAGEDETP